MTRGVTIINLICLNPNRKEREKDSNIISVFTCLSACTFIHLPTGFMMSKIWIEQQDGKILKKKKANTWPGDYIYKKNACFCKFCVSSSYLLSLDSVISLLSHINLYIIFLFVWFYLYWYLPLFVVVFFIRIINFIYVFDSCCSRAMIDFCVRENIEKLLRKRMLEIFM